MLATSLFFPDSASDVKLLFEVNIFVQCDRYKHLDDQRDRPPYSMTHCPCINKYIRTWLNAEHEISIDNFSMFFLFFLLQVKGGGEYVPKHFCPPTQN